jgi:hypothetical protein
MLLHRIQEASSIQELILDVCKSESNEQAGMFAMLAWVLWQNRNNMVWCDTKETGRNLGLKARHLWEEWYEIQQAKYGPSQTAQQQQVYRWEKPQHGWFKCNIDAGF